MSHVLILLMLFSSGHLRLVQPRIVKTTNPVQATQTVTPAQSSSNYSVQLVRASRVSIPH